jgi:hypothetical protein
MLSLSGECFSLVCVEWLSRKSSASALRVIRRSALAQIRCGSVPFTPCA